MIKPREARRGGGATRCKQSSGHSHKLFSCLDGAGGGDFVLSSKSKKERLRKLSALGLASSSFQYCEMGCDLSDREDELPSKRFKLPKKFFGDCNAVAHASVPRKLRSAMKKRESASPSTPNSKKLNHALTGIKSPKRDGEIEPNRHLKHGGLEGSQKETVSGDITKDEEEVVETLYALAGLFPNDDPNDNSKIEAESLDANPSASPVSESPTHVVEAGKDKDKLGSTFQVRPTEVVSPSSVESLAKGTDQVDTLKKPSTQHELELPNSINSDNSVRHIMSSLSIKVQECNDKPIANDINFFLPSDLSLESRLKQPVRKEASVFRRKPETALELGTTTQSHVELHGVDYESKKNGPVLWPGLSSPVSLRARNGSQSSASQPPPKIPAWLNTAMSSSRASVQNGSSFRKVSKVVNGRWSCKKCAAHVYISHLIQALQNAQSKQKLQPGANQTRSQEGSKPMDLLGVNIYPKVKNGLNGIASTTDKNPDEAENGTLQPQPTMGSPTYTSPKRSFDFMSLSAGVGGFETNDGFSRGRNGIEPSSQSRVPYIQSHMQHHALIPFNLPQSHHGSSARPNNPSVAQQAQLQLQQYHLNPFSGPQATPTALTKQQPQQLHLQLQQQQQQQQRLWAAQMAAQYRQVGGTSTSALHFPSLQNGRQETTLIPCGQMVMSSSSSTLELVGPKFAPLSQQQQQQLMAVTSSFPPGRVKHQDHHLPSMYEESGGGFRAGSALPLQLLCGERL